MSWLHLHRDPNWQQHGIHRYDQCRCGARRTMRAYASIAGPSRADWPSLVDRHGVERDSSGWQPEPAGGWPTPQPKPKPPTSPGGFPGLPLQSWVRSVCVDDETWDRATQRAKDEGLIVKNVLLDFLIAYGAGSLDALTGDA